MEQNQIEGQKGGRGLQKAVLVFGAIVAVALIYIAGTREVARQKDTVASVSETVGTGAKVTAAGALKDDDVVLGDPMAPVTLVIFGDYQCPFCEKEFQESELKLRDEYVAKGLLNMVYRDFPLDSIHPYARGAAEAAECARDGGKYWLYHDTLYKRQRELGRIDFVSLAGDLGIDTKVFKECIDSSRTKAEVEKDLQDGIALGIEGTPANFINGQALPGAVPYSEFKSAIDAILRRNGVQK